MTILMKTSICGKMVNFFFRMCFSSFHPKLYLLWPTFFTAFAFFLIFFLLFFISFCQSCIHKQKMPLIWRIFFSLMFFTAWPIRPKLIESLHFIIFGILLRSLVIVVFNFPIKPQYCHSVLVHCWASWMSATTIFVIATTIFAIFYSLL